MRRETKLSQNVHFKLNFLLLLLGLPPADLQCCQTTLCFRRSRLTPKDTTEIKIWIKNKTETEMFSRVFILPPLQASHFSWTCRWKYFCPKSRKKQPDLAVLDRRWIQCETYLIFTLWRKNTLISFKGIKEEGEVKFRCSFGSECETDGTDLV